MATKRNRLIERAKSRVRSKAGGRLKPGDFSSGPPAKSGDVPPATPEAPAATESTDTDQTLPLPSEAVEMSPPEAQPSEDVKTSTPAVKARSSRAKKKKALEFAPLPPFEVPPPVETPPRPERPPVETAPPPPEPEPSVEAPAPPVEAPRPVEPPQTPTVETAERSKPLAPAPPAAVPQDASGAGSTWGFLEEELSAKATSPVVSEEPGPARPTLPPTPVELPAAPPLKVADPPAFRSPLSPRTSAFGSVDDAEFAARIDSVASIAKLVDEPAYVLAATPNRPSRTPGALDLNNPRVTKLVTDPPQLRNFGFDLDAGGAAQIADGWLRRAEGERYKALGLWDDGTLIFVATAGEEFLCWGRQLTEHGLLLNESALVESTYLFAELARRLHAGLQLTMPEIEFRLVLRDVMPEGSPISISTSRDGGFADEAEEDVYSAPAAGARFDARHPKDAGPGAVAYSLVAQVYAWFGIDEAKIPFSERSPDGAGLIAASRIKW